MSEPIPVLTGGHEEVPALGLVDRVAQLVTRELAKCLEQSDVKVAPDHRRRDQHSLRRLGKPFYSAADQSPHALRELQVLFCEAGLAARAAAEHRVLFGHV